MIARYHYARAFYPDRWSLLWSYPEYRWRVIWADIWWVVAGDR